jgi:hypothetical protein
LYRYIPGETGISRAALTTLIRSNRECLRELHAHSAYSGDGRGNGVDGGDGGGGGGGELLGCWTPKQVHAAVSAAGPRFRRLAVDVKSRGGAVQVELSSSGRIA